MSQNKSFPESAILFADGACSGNPGPGGWGTVLYTPDGNIKELGGKSPSTTNNQMELTAAIEGLAEFEKASLECPIWIYTDSLYVIRGITQWIWNWLKTDWKSSEGKPVANIDLWKKLFSLNQSKKAVWKYVAGHSGVPGNERVDQIAVEFSQGRLPFLYEGKIKDYSVPLFPLPPDLPLGLKKSTAPPPGRLTYLSVVNHIPMRHFSWNECEQRVKGQRGARFKKAKNSAEEAAILSEWGFKVSDLKDSES